jgi:hypothetical protein
VPTKSKKAFPITYRQKKRFIRLPNEVNAAAIIQVFTHWWKTDQGQPGCDEAIAEEV